MNYTLNLQKSNKVGLIYVPVTVNDPKKGTYISGRWKKPSELTKEEKKKYGKQKPIALGERYYSPYHKDSGEVIKLQDGFDLVQLRLDKNGKKAIVRFKDLVPEKTPKVKEKKETPKKTAGAKSPAVSKIDEIQEKYGLDGLLEEMKKRNINWKEHPAHRELNIMRAKMALKKHLESGGEWKDTIDSPSLSANVKLVVLNDLKASMDWIIGQEISVQEYASDFIARKPKLIPKGTTTDENIGKEIVMFVEPIIDRERNTPKKIGINKYSYKGMEYSLKNKTGTSHLMIEGLGEVGNYQKYKGEYEAESHFAQGKDNFKSSLVSASDAQRFILDGCLKNPKVQERIKANESPKNSLVIRDGFGGLKNVSLKGFPNYYVEVIPKSEGYISQLRTQEGVHICSSGLVSSFKNAESWAFNELKERRDTPVPTVPDNMVIKDINKTEKKMAIKGENGYHVRMVQHNSGTYTCELCNSTGLVISGAHTAYGLPYGDAINHSKDLLENYSSEIEGIKAKLKKESKGVSIPKEFQEDMNIILEKCKFVFPGVIRENKEIVQDVVKSAIKINGLEEAKRKLKGTIKNIEAKESYFWSVVKEDLAKLGIKPKSIPSMKKQIRENKIDCRGLGEDQKIKIAGLLKIDSVNSAPVIEEKSELNLGDVIPYVPGKSNYKKALGCGAVGGILVNTPNFIGNSTWLISKEALGNKLPKIEEAAKDIAEKHGKQNKFRSPNRINATDELVSQVYTKEEAKKQLGEKLVPIKAIHKAYETITWGKKEHVNGVILATENQKWEETSKNLDYQICNSIIYDLIQNSGCSLHVHKANSNYLIVTKNNEPVGIMCPFRKKAMPKWNELVSRERGNNAKKS